MSGPAPRAGIMQIAPYVGGDSRIEGRAEAIKLSSNESALGPSPRAIAAYRAAAQALHRYPDGGANALRQAIASHFGLPIEQIVCGNGSDEIISQLVHAYAGPGDEVLHSRHGFLMYRISTLAAGATPVSAPEADHTASVDALLAAITPRTRLLFLANPNNPTGTYLPASELRRLHAGLPGHVLLVIDAAYAEYVSRNDYSAGIELVAENENVVMTRTFSKIFGLAALRLGWAYCPPAVAQVLHRVRSPFNVNSAAQAAGIAALADIGHTDAARTHNDIWLPWLARQLAALGLRSLPSVGNFLSVAFGESGPRSAAEALAFLNGKGLLPRAIDAYGMPGFLRVTVGREEENRAFVAAVAEFMEQADG